MRAEFLNKYSERNQDSHQNSSKTIEQYAKNNEKIISNEVLNNNYNNGNPLKISKINHNKTKSYIDHNTVTTYNWVIYNWVKFAIFKINFFTIYPPVYLKLGQTKKKKWVKLYIKAKMAQKI